MINIFIQMNKNECITVIPPIFAADRLKFVLDYLDFTADHPTLLLLNIN